jgi:hypothetical protein
MIELAGAFVELQPVAKPTALSPGNHEAQREALVPIAIVGRSYLHHAPRLPRRPAHAGQTGLNSNGWAAEWSRRHLIQLTSSDASGANWEGQLVKSSKGCRVEIESPFDCMESSVSTR